MKKIIQLKVVLDEITPKIWREFSVDNDISFNELHNIIQIVMGWGNYHMFEFRIDNETITSNEEGFNLAEASFKKLFKSSEFIKILENQDLSKGSPTLDVNKMNKILKDMEKNKPKVEFNVDTKINKLIKSEEQKFTYTYDFGDNWGHTVTVEKILDEKDVKEYPSCLKGERACPPEDCGSIDGYYDLLKIKKNKKHPRYKEMIIGWLGEDFDFELFNINKINKELKKINKRMK